MYPWRTVARSSHVTYESKDYIHLRVSYNLFQVVLGGKEILRVGRAYLELDDSLVAGLTTAVTRLIRRGNCPAIRFFVDILFETSGSFNRPEGILH